MDMPLNVAAPDDHAKGLQSRFFRDGFVGPLDALSPGQCLSLTKYLDDTHRPKPRDWVKGFAASDRLLYELAMQPSLVNP